MKKVTPHLVAAFLIVTLSSIGLPGLNGFVGEFLILLGAFRWDPRLAAFAATGVILSATYMLWMFQRVNYGPVTNEKNARLSDLQPREWAVIVPIIAVAILMGVLPEPVPAADRAVGRADAEPGSAGARRAHQARRMPKPRAPSPVAASHAMMTPRFNAIVPMACVDRGRHRRDGGRGVPRSGRADADRRRSASSASLGAALATVLLWNHNASSFGVVAADNFGLFVTGIADRRRPAVAGDLRSDRSSASGCRAASITR